MQRSNESIHRGDGKRVLAHFPAREFFQGVEHEAQ
jgi:hypothetical protein